MSDDEGVNTSVAGRLSRRLENHIADAWRAIDAGSEQPIPARYRIPHLSFQLLERPPSETTKAMLRRLTDHWAPLPIRLDGLGIFKSPRPVLYITVVRSPQLEAFHREVMFKLVEAGHTLHPLYRPERWVPHVSIAFGTPGVSGWQRVLEQQAEGIFHRRARVESLLALSADQRCPLMFEYPLCGGQNVAGDEGR